MYNSYSNLPFFYSCILFRPYGSTGFGPSFINTNAGLGAQPFGEYANENYLFVFSFYFLKSFINELAWFLMVITYKQG
jgi:hypothetical protein